MSYEFEINHILPALILISFLILIIIVIKYLITELVFNRVSRQQLHRVSINIIGDYDLPIYSVSVDSEEPPSYSQ